jgi:hypothetical protein
MQVAPAVRHHGLTGQLFCLDGGIMSRWFRVYDDLVDDPKVQRLPPDLFKYLINLWCLASQNGGKLPAIADIAFKLRINDSKVRSVLAELDAAGLIDVDETSVEMVIAPHNWEKRQFKSDVSTNRVKAFRERQTKRNGAVT